MTNDLTRLNTRDIRPSARRTRRRFLAAALAVAGSAAFGCGGPTPTGQPRPSSSPTAALRPAVDRWQRAAQSEGEVRVYADLSQDEVRDLESGFGQVHPGLSIGWLRGLDRELLARAQEEARQGRSEWDVFVGDLGTRLKTAGLADQWSPPEAAALRPEYADPDGAWHAVAATYHVLQYHTEQVPPAARPARYEDLAQPGWQGRLAAEEEPLTWLAGVVEQLGRDSAVQRLAPLAGHGIVLRRGSEALSRFVAAGQHAIGVSNRHDAVERDRRAGAKTAWVALDPVIAQPTAVVVAGHAPHPNAARLFANFLLSADAQVALALRGRVPARQDVDPEPQGLVRGLRPHVILPPEGAAEQSLRELYGQLWRW